MKRSTSKVNINNAFFIIGVLLIVFFWCITSMTKNNELLIPKVSSVLFRVIEFIKDTYILKIIFNTLLKIIVIIVISFIIAIVLSVFSYKFIWFQKIISPIIILMRVVPIASVVIILLIYIGFKYTPYYICSFVVLPIMYESILNSFNNIDKDILEETKMISNINLNIFIKIIIPLSFKTIFSAIISTFGLGLKVLVMAEIISSTQDTFGGVLQIYRSLSDMTSIFALTIILIFIDLIIEYLIKKMKSKI